MTSTQAVGKIRWLFQAQKAGHAGTLDPLASGVLPIALGEATKTVPFMMDAHKAYDFTITWGQSTDTLDAEGAVIDRSDVRPRRADIEAALPGFIGEIDQVPPKYSAIKLGGQRAYDLARAGQAVDIQPRLVRVDGLEITACEPDYVSLRVWCGKGTYVRSLARDLAARLGACGYVSHLRRIRVGPFDQSNAFSLDEIEKLCHRGDVLDSLQPLQAALDDIPVIHLSEAQTEHLKHGRAIALSSLSFPNTHAIGSQCILAMQDDMAVALCDIDGMQLQPRRVFNM